LTAETQAVRSALRRIRKMVSFKEGEGVILTSQYLGVLMWYGYDSVYAGAEEFSAPRIE
jgi:hypothetical protein